MIGGLRGGARGGTLSPPSYNCDDAFLSPRTDPNADVQLLDSLPSTPQPVHPLAVGSDDMLHVAVRPIAKGTKHPDGPEVQFFHPERGPAEGGTVVSVRGTNFGSGLHDIVQLECGGHDVSGTATYVSPVLIRFVTIGVHGGSGGSSGGSGGSGGTAPAHPAHHNNAWGTKHAWSTKHASIVLCTDLGSAWTNAKYAFEGNDATAPRGDGARAGTATSTSFRSDF